MGATWPSGLVQVTSKLLVAREASPPTTVSPPRGSGGGAVDGDRLGAGGGGVAGGVFDDRLELVLAFTERAQVDRVARVCGHVGTGNRLAVVAGAGVPGLLAAVDEPGRLGDPGV